MRRTEGLPHSVHVRLVRHARAIGMDPNFVLARYAVERFLYRLSTPHSLSDPVTFLRRSVISNMSR